MKTTHGSLLASAPSVLLLLCIAAPLTLAEAESLALANQPTLRQARANLQGASGRAIENRSGYLPQGTFNAGYQRTTGNFAQRPGSGITAQPTWTGQTYNYFNLTAQVSQLVFDFGVSSSRWRAGEHLENQAKDDYNAAEQSVLLNVRRAYFQARAQQELSLVAQENTKNQEKHLQQIEGLVKASLRPDIDLASARTDLANARAAQIQAEGNSLIAFTQLGQALGTPTRADWQLADASLPALADEGAAPETLIDEAMKTRPEYAALDNERRARESQLWMAKGSYGPALGVTAGASLAGVQTLIPNWFVGATLTWTFLQGGFTFGQVREADANLQATLARIDALRLQVRVEVEQAHVGLRVAKAQQGAYEEAKKNAADQLRLAEGRYSNGLGGVIELGDAQVAYANAAAQAVQGQYAVVANRAQLMTALGRKQ